MERAKAASAIHGVDIMSATKDRDVNVVSTAGLPEINPIPGATDLWGIGVSLALAFAVGAGRHGFDPVPVSALKSRSNINVAVAVKVGSMRLPGTVTAFGCHRNDVTSGAELRAGDKVKLFGRFADPSMGKFSIQDVRVAESSKGSLILENDAVRTRSLDPLLFRDEFDANPAHLVCKSA